MVPKPGPATEKLDKRRGSIMWTFIINLIYEQSCSKHLADVARHQQRWI